MKSELANEILEAMVQATQELVVANQEMSVINLDDLDNFNANKWSSKYE